MQQLIARARLVALYVILIAPFVIWGAIHALESSNNSPIDWVGPEFPERQHYDAFVGLFGHGDAVIASWPGCVVTDSRLDKLMSTLRNSRAFLNADGVSSFESVVCGREVLLQMSRPQTSGDFAQQPASRSEDSLDNEDSAAGSGGLAERRRFQPQEAIKRLQGTLIGADGETTCVICTFTPAGLRDRAVVVHRIRRAIELVCETSDEDIHLAGPVIDGLTVDEASHRSLTRYAGPSAIIILVICWLSLKDPIAAGVVFLTAVACQCLILAVIYFSGERLSALLIILPPLVQVLAVSGGIHLMNYYLNALEHLEPRQAAIDAFHKGWLPSLLSLGTTAMGTASLMISELRPIRLFGIYGTVGILLAAASVLTFIPCAMMLIGRRRSDRPRALDEIPSGAKTSSPWSQLAGILTVRNTPIVITLCGIMVAAGLGLPDLKTSIRIETLFPHDSRIMRDYAWLEEHLGALVPIEVLVRFGPNAELNDRMRMDILWQVNDVLEHQPHIRSTTSALTYLPPLPSMKSIPATLRTGLLNRAIFSARPGFEQLHCLTHDNGEEIWRITAHVGSLDPLDYGQILSRITQSIRVAMRESLQDERCALTIETSGIMPLVHQIQGQLLTDLFASLLSALLVITITMTIVEAGLLNGLLAMVSNLFPIVTAFGVMGWLQHPMDIGSVMTASVALGIAVDDTLHFLTFFRRALAVHGTSRLQAVCHAYDHCGRAMIQTSVSCGMGLLVFALSDFVPTSRFAILIVCLLGLALLGDLLLLPAILLSPAGRFFEPLRDSTPANVPPESPATAGVPGSQQTHDFASHSSTPRENQPVSAQLH
ncbi:MAG: MMPL family transporter [Planctomycetaceae bacterium]